MYQDTISGNNFRYEYVSHIRIDRIQGQKFHKYLIFIYSKISKITETRTLKIIYYGSFHSLHHTCHV